MRRGKRKEGTVVLSKVTSRKGKGVGSKRGGKKRGGRSSIFWSWRRHRNHYINSGDCTGAYFPVEKKGEERKEEEMVDHFCSPKRKRSYTSISLI